jgi:hypothetical protein
MLLCALSVMAFAQAPDQSDQERPANPDFINLNMGYQLAKYGYEMQSPVASMEAARIISQVQTQELKEQPTERGDTVDDNEVKFTYFTYDPWEILADAKMFALGDSALLVMIDRIEEEMKNQDIANRGKESGPACETSTVAAHSYVIYTVSFPAGKLAEVFVVGDGDTDLEVYIYDQNDNLIVSDHDHIETPYLSWVPQGTAPFKIKIVNLGDVFNRYRICVN